MEANDATFSSSENMEKLYICCLDTEDVHVRKYDLFAGKAPFSNMKNDKISAFPARPSEKEGRGAAGLCLKYGRTFESTFVLSKVQYNVR